MAEVTFARQFLNLLDAKPAPKLSSDYVLDPRNLPAQPPYILPRMPKPLSKRPRTTTAASTSAATGLTDSPSPATLTITLKPLRQPPAPITLTSVAPQTSIYDVKARCAAQTGYAPEKVKILWERKPVADSKTVGEVVGEGVAGGGGEVEFGVMFVGAPTKEPVRPGEEEEAPEVVKGEGKDVEMKEAAAPVAQGLSGKDVLKTKEFWEDLRGFVLQRVRDEEVAAEVFKGFRESWKEG